MKAVDKGCKPFKQSGVALVVGVVFLLVALILALSSMQAARLGETMAGNARASDRALMAAEYGASVIAEIVNDEEYSGDGGIVALLADVQSAVSGSVGGYYAVDENSFFRVEVDAGSVVEDSVVRVFSVGEVFSGAPDEGGEVVARRRLYFEFDIDIGYPAPVSMMCPVGFEMPSTPSGVEAEPEVDSQGRYRPAVAAGSPQNAALVTAEILSAEIAPDSVPAVIQSSGNDKYKAVLVNQDGILTYHAAPVVPDSESGSVDCSGADANCGINYDLNCKVQTNPMCGIVGGVSEVAGAPPLASPFLMHNFIDALFSVDPAEHIFPDGHEKSGEEVIVYIDASEFSEGMIQTGKINIITSGRYHVLSAHEGSGAGDSLIDKPLVFSVDGVAPDPAVSEAGSLNISVAGAYEDNAITPSDVAGSEPGYTVGMWAGLEGALFDYPVGGVNYFPNDYGVLEAEALLRNEVDEVSYEFSGVDLYVSAGFEDIYYFDGASYELDVGFQELDFLSNGRSVDVSFGEGFNSGEEPTLIVVDGDMEIGTQPQINGLVVVLGDYLGQGGGPEPTSYVNGSIVVAPYFFDSSTSNVACQDAVFNVGGAGNFKVNFDIGNIKEVLKLLPADVLLQWIGDSEITPIITVWRESMEN